MNALPLWARVLFMLLLAPLFTSAFFQTIAWVMPLFSDPMEQLFAEAFADRSQIRTNIQLVHLLHHTQTSLAIVLAAIPGTLAFMLLSSYRPSLFALLSAAIFVATLVVTKMWVMLLTSGLAPVPFLCVVFAFSVLAQLGIVRLTEFARRRLTTRWSGP